MLAQTFLPFLALATFTVLEGVRRRLWLPSLGILLVGISLAGFMGSLAITEAQQIRSGLLGAFLRLAAVLLASLYVLHSQAQEYQNKGLALLFSLPISRSVYFFGKLAGYFLLALAMVWFFSFALLFFSTPASVAFWGGALFLELCIVVAFSFLVQLTVRQVPTAFLIVLFFYLLSRTIASLQLVGQGAIMPQDSLSLVVINAVLHVMAFILPSLDRFAPSEWLMYGSASWHDLWLVIVQGVGYLIFLCGVVLVDLHRKHL